MSRLRVRIIAVPPGEAPLWVREKWVGLELPLAQSSPVPRTYKSVGVLAAPRTLLGCLWDVFSTRHTRNVGFKVNAAQAVALLESTSPEAAAWWRTHTPYLLKSWRYFLFPETVCETVE